MKERMKVAQRHIRPVHYHHRSSFNMPNVENKVRHRKYTTSSKKQQSQSVASMDQNLVQKHELGVAIDKDKLTGLFSRKKKKQKAEKTSSSSKAVSKKKKHGKHYALKKFIVKMAVVAAVFYIVLTYVFGIKILYGNYMYPAIRDGDLVITYKLQTPIINDVVMYQRDGELRFGRVVAKENATIKYDSETETYSVNGIVPSESIFYTTKKNDDANIEYPYTVPAGCVYVLNDHRDDMTDSRTYEAISVNELQGVVVFVIRRRGF